MTVFNLKRLSELLTYPNMAEKLSHDEWFSFILILRESRLLASFYYLSIREECFELFPLYVGKHLKSASVRAERQRTQVVFECVTLDDTLAEIDVKPVYMKGANYILRNSKSGLGRLVSDIDILVNKKDITAVEQLLKSKLWKSEEISDYDDKYYRSWAHEIPPMYHLLRHTVLDIHHNIYLPISGCSPNIEPFKKAVKKTQAGCLVLSDAATVLHSIIHLYMNEDFTNAYRDMLDIHLLINEFESEDFWFDLNELATASGFDKELYYCLVLQNRLFGTSKLNENLTKRFENKWSNFFIHKILYHALTPKHYLLDTYRSKVARFIVFIRGHWLKMPVHILITHLTIKSYNGIVDKLFGKHFLEKEG